MDSVRLHHEGPVPSRAPRVCGSSACWYGESQSGADPVVVRDIILLWADYVRATW